MIMSFMELKRMHKELDAEISAAEDEIKNVIGAEKRCSPERSKSLGRLSLLPVSTARP